MARKKAKRREAVGEGIFLLIKGDEELYAITYLKLNKINIFKREPLVLRPIN